VNFARLNHILIPSTKAGRDRLRRTFFGRLFTLSWVGYYVLSREGRVVAWMWIFAGLLGMDVRMRQSYLVWSVLTGLLLMALIIRRFFALDGVKLSLHVPRRVAVGDEVAFTVRFKNSSHHEHQSIRISGPLLPWDGKYLTRKMALRSLPPGETCDVPVRARFIARGEHHLDPFVAAALVPLGLSEGPILISKGVRFLVVPKIAPVRRLRTPMVQRYQPGGVTLASRTGESMELLGLRPYRPGDPVRDIHAKTWARLGVPVVREYQQEYFTRIGVVVDTDIRVADEARMEAALSLAAGVVAHLSRGEALIDLLVVGQEIHQLTLGRSLGFLDQALDLLACVGPGPKLDPDLLGKRLAPHLAQLSSVVLISLAWDEPRQTLADRIRSGGVACRVLLVTRNEDGDDRGRGAIDLSRISLRTINAAKGIEL
jgi:uncharacterized protein (DUF58 family)